MDDFLDLKIPHLYQIDDIVESAEWNSFSDAVDELMEFASPTPYLERRITIDNSNGDGAGMKMNGRNSIRDIGRKTKRSFNDTAKAYDAAVNLSAAGIDAGWTIVAKAWGLIATCMNFMASNISRIPAAIENLANKIEDLPHEVMSKIRGDIKLYYRAEDIPAIYNGGLLRGIERYYAVLKELSHGDTWKRFNLLQKGANAVGDATKRVLSTATLGAIKGDPSKDDYTKLKQLQKEYNGIRYVNIDPTVIRMSDHDTLRKYFIDTDTVKLPDGDYSYLKAMQKLSADLERANKDLKDVQSIFDTKLDRTKMGSSFGNLDAKAQRLIQDVSRMTAVVTRNTSAVIKYVIADVKTINGVYQKVQGAINNP